MAEGKQPPAGAGAAQRVVVAFPEHVNVSNATQIAEELLTAFADGAAVVIADLSATVSCDGACADVVARACQRATVRQAELRVVATASAVRQLLAEHGLDRLVAVYPSVAAAVAAGQPDRPHPAGDVVPPMAAPPRRGRLQASRGDGPGPGSLTSTVLRQLIDVLADGIVLVDEDGRIVLANRQAAATFGYRPGELATQPVESLVPTALRDSHRLDRAAYARKPVSRPMADRARLVGLRQDGTTVPVTITLSPVPTASGHFVLVVVKDATREWAQEDLTGLVQAAAAERVQRAEGLLDRVVGSLFHVGLSLNEAAGQPAELARERISEALLRLDDTIHEIRDHVFRSRRPGGGTAW
jgi:PAS domain S-box-containing protein